MKGKSVYKIPDGKLVKIELEFDNKKILGLKIFGDFFVYPEEGIEKVENALLGQELSEKQIVLAVESAKKKLGLEFFGISSTGLSAAILLAKESAEGEKK